MTNRGLNSTTVPSEASLPVLEGYIEGSGSVSNMTEACSIYIGSYEKS